MNLRTYLALASVAALAVTTPVSPVFARGHHSHTRGEARASHHSPRGHRLLTASSSDPAQTPDQLKPYLIGTYPHPVSRYAVLMDVNTGKLLYAVNGDAKREPASLTKIMAATVLLEKGRLNDTVTAPEDVVGVPESSLHLRVGEKLSLEDLLYAMLLRSANDTPVAGASYLSGSIPDFVDLMNRKAAEEGCVNTHFVTPNGLYDPEHYSTAHDLAIMARYAMTNLPMFDEIVKTQRYKIRRSIDQNDTVVTNTATSYLKYFPGADGIKTGFISQAGHCFVGSATRGGWRLIAVALDSGKCREDVEGMLSYGFAHYAPVEVFPKGKPEGTITIPGADSAIPVETGADLDNVLSKDHLQAAPAYTTSVAALSAGKIQMPIMVGDKVGTVTLFADGKPVTTVDAVASQPVGVSTTMAGSLPLSGTLAFLGKLLGTVVASTVGIVLLALSALKLYAGALTKNSRRRRARLTAQVRGVD